MKNRTWIIIDCRSNTALYGVNKKTLMFSTEAIAQEVGSQFFFEGTDFIIFDIDTLTK